MRIGNNCSWDVPQKGTFPEKKMHSFWDVRKRDFSVMFPQLYVNYWTSGMAFLQALGHFRAPGDRDTNAYHLISQNLIDPVSHPPLSFSVFNFISLSFSISILCWLSLSLSKQGHRNTLGTDQTIKSQLYLLFHLSCLFPKTVYQK